MNSHYKIIHTTCHTQWGGLEKRIFNEAVWMRNNGHDIIVAAPRNTLLLHKSRQNGFRTYEVAFKKSEMISDYRFLRRVFANEQPDIVKTHGNEDSRIALLAAYQKKIGCRILSRHISAHVRDSWHNRLIYKKYATHIFTTADYTTRHLKNVFKLNDRQVFSMPSGILPPDTLPPPPPPPGGNRPKKIWMRRSAARRIPVPFYRVCGPPVRGQKAHHPGKSI
jgi:hypothetical protein